MTLPHVNYDDSIGFLVQYNKYVGLKTVQSNGKRGREVKKRVQAGWNWWRRMPGVIYDRRVPAISSMYVFFNSPQMRHVKR